MKKTICSNQIVRQLLMGALFLFGTPLFAATAHARISMERAKEIATKKVPGTIKSSEYEHEMGQDVYSFDITGKDNKIHEVLVSANTGKIVSSTIETPAKEAAEQKADQTKGTDSSSP